MPICAATSSDIPLLRIPDPRMHTSHAADPIRDPRGQLLQQLEPVGYPRTQGHPYEYCFKLVEGFAYAHHVSAFGLAERW